MKRLTFVDIETMKGERPEIALAPFLKGLRGNPKSDPVTQDFQVRAKREKILNDKVLLTPVASRILCIGVREIVEPGIGDYVNGVKVEDNWHFIYDPDEKKMIQKFIMLTNPATKYVTFNGRTFDFPFLMFRAAVMKENLSLPIYPYNGRDNHIDIFIHLNNISNLSMLDNSLSMIGMAKWREYLALAPKTQDPTKLEELVITGQLDKVEEYVKGDVDELVNMFNIFSGNFEL